jgi:hypothetical protein
VTTPVPGPVPGPGVGQDEGLDDARRALETVSSRPVGEHVAVYDAVHRQLQSALAALDEG